MEKSRNSCMDIMKAVAAFMVVMIHVHPDTTIYNGLVAICRMAVPFFFMISGYYSGSFVSLKTRRVVNNIKKILKLVILSNLAYFLIEIGYACLQNELADYVGSLLNMQTWIKFVVFNTSPFSTHLWYLSAYLYVLLIDYLTSKMNVQARVKVDRIIPAIIPLLLLVDLIMGKYAVVIFGRTFPVDIVRNFMFVGLPYYYLGRILSSEGIAAWVTKVRCGFKGVLLSIVLIGASVACTLTEYGFFTASGLVSTRDHYIGTTLLAVSVFLVTMLYPNVGKNSFLKTIGGGYSLSIYLIHPILIKVLRIMLTRFDFYGEFEYVAAVVVYILSLAITHIWMSLKKYLKGAGVARLWRGKNDECR